MKCILDRSYAKRLCTVGLVSIAALALLTGTANADDIPPGDDVWVTGPNGVEEDFSSDPIPAGFFEPGSDPFSGWIYYEGAGTGCFDTVVRRLEKAAVLRQGATATVDIEIVSLNLVSSSPVTITPVGDQWDVGATLSGIVAQPGGDMTITQSAKNGGTYSSSQEICPKLTFQRTTPPFDVRVLDVCNDQGMGAARLLTTTNKPWGHDVETPLVCANSSSNFVPFGPHDGLHPGAEPVESLTGPILPALGAVGVVLAALALVGSFAALQRRRNRS